MKVLCQKRGAIAIVTINRPEARNAIDVETNFLLGEAFDAIEADDEVHVAIITGAGDRAFSAGVDLKAHADLGSNTPFTEASGGFAGLSRRDFSKVLISAVNGYAIGGGFEIALASDLIVASAETFFSSPEAKLGMISDGGGIVRLPHWLPLPMAKELLLLGNRIPARRLYELGFVNRLAEADDVLDVAISLAEEICSNAPEAVRVSKMAVHAALNLSEEEAWQVNDAFAEIVAKTDDFLEGSRAFKAKRTARFLGR